MQKTNLLANYTTLGDNYQCCLPLNFEFQIPKDDPVRLLRYEIGGMDLTTLYHTYQRINKNLASPRQLLAILIYAGMNHVFSSRHIETACQRDINYMYLLEGKSAPDHATISRFRSKHLAPCIRNIFSQMDSMLYKIGAISFENIFIDGTKFESVANKYTFVWKKSVMKNKAKLLEKLPAFVEKAEQIFSVSIHHGDIIKLYHLKKLLKKLKQFQLNQGIFFVHGIGRRKTELQRTMEMLNQYILRLKDYQKKLHIMGNRNSFSKTDNDATFMRLKEDAMLNGQLKPAYNIQYGIDSEFVTWATVEPQPTDTNTLIPFLKDFEMNVHQSYKNVIADAGYESEENYTYLEKHQIRAFIKPNNYEKSKTRKWKNDIGRRENMEYIEEQDVYICANGRQLKNVNTYHHAVKATGYVSLKTNYVSETCDECTLKSQCIHGNNWSKPLEERTKHLTVAKKFIRQRAEDLKRIKSKEGIWLRVNRSIQSEGTFADVKGNMKFRRFLSRGKNNVLVETMILAMAHNFLKLHHKVQLGRLGQHLFSVDKVA